MSCSTFRNPGGSSCGKNDDKSQSSACEVGERLKRSRKSLLRG